MLSWRMLAAVAVMALVASEGLAVRGRLGPGRFFCPDCGCSVCVPEPATLKTKKHCFEVEWKDICIPAVKGPCAPCCQEPSCGRVRTVKVLKKVEYECEHCGYKWKVQTVCDGPAKAPPAPQPMADAYYSGGDLANLRAPVIPAPPAPSPAPMLQRR